MSGKLGPKLKEGDLQAPEGFYEVGKKQLNPMSRFHLSFNVGYPNAYDRYHGRTGSLIMVHGSNVSIGCFAMTDPVIEEIYLLVEAALKGGQEAVKVQVFPFRMTPEKMSAVEGEWAGFWRDELWPGYERFERTGVPPEVGVREGRYRVGE
jgi:murein L,D-transpeptidase YafK